MLEPSPVTFLALVNGTALHRNTHAVWNPESSCLLLLLSTFQRVLPFYFLNSWIYSSTHHDGNSVLFHVHSISWPLFYPPPSLTLAPVHPPLCAWVNVLKCKCAQFIPLFESSKCPQCPKKNVLAAWTGLHGNPTHLPSPVILNPSLLHQFFFSLLKIVVKTPHII